MSTKEPRAYKCWSHKDWRPIRRRRLAGGPGYEKMGVASWHIRTLTPVRFPLHLGGFVLIQFRIWWASGLQGNAPLHSRHYAHQSLFIPILYHGVPIHSNTLIENTDIIQNIVIVHIGTIYPLFVPCIKFFLFSKFLPIGDQTPSVHSRIWKSPEIDGHSSLLFRSQGHTSMCLVKSTKFVLWSKKIELPSHESVDCFMHSFTLINEHSD